MGGSYTRAGGTLERMESNASQGISSTPQPGASGLFEAFRREGPAQRCPLRDFPDPHAESLPYPVPSLCPPCYYLLGTCQSSAVSYSRCQVGLGLSLQLNGKKTNRVTV